MVQLTIDDEQKRRFLEGSGVAELRDTSGKLLGLVTPVSERAPCAHEHFPELTKEEIDRRCDEPGAWLTTEQVKQRLRELCNDSGALLDEHRQNLNHPAVEWEQVTPDMPQEEIERLATSDDWCGMTTAEVKQFLSESR